MKDKDNQEDTAKNPINKNDTPKKDQQHQTHKKDKSIQDNPGDQNTG